MEAVLETRDIAKLFNRGDVILTHGNGPADRLIQWATGSHWNHVAIVFVLSDEASGHEEGYRRTFIIEAESHGVDIHPIDKYLHNEGQDMAVLRLPDGAVPPDIRVDFLRRVRGFALEEIDAGYGYEEIGGIVKRLFGLVAAPIAWLVTAGNLLFKTPGVSEVVNRWICSGVVQYAYYRACFGAKTSPDDMWRPSFFDNKRRAGLIVSPELSLKIAEGLEFEKAKPLLKLTTPAEYARAAKIGRLQVVAERTNRHWNRTLSHL